MHVTAVLLLAVQVAFAVHAVRTGRSQYWLYFILFVPAVGCAVYFFAEVLPGMRHSRTLSRTHNTLMKAVDPQRELRQRKDELAISDNLDNRLRLAEECMEANLPGEAVALYESCLDGHYRNDPYIMLKLASASFLDGQPMRAKSTLEDLIAANPDFKSTEGHLLYARALEDLDRHDEAALEYETLLTSYPGEEARVRYAMMLKKRGQTERAGELFEETVLRARRAPRHYLNREKAWIRLAQDDTSKRRAALGGR